MSKKEVLVVGAGRSSNYLLHKLHQAGHIKLSIADISIEGIELRYPNANVFQLDIDKCENISDRLMRNACAPQLIIGMLPRALQPKLAQYCLFKHIDLILPSDLLPEVAKLNSAVAAQNLRFICGVGLDPGWDHIFTQKEIDTGMQAGATIKGVSSYCGGLPADPNDFYQFTWNPMNVILAGQCNNRYRKDGQWIDVPYEALFADNQTITLNGQLYEWYINRDAKPYLEHYKISNVPNFKRATLRYPGFNRFWHTLIQLGFTDNKEQMHCDDPVDLLIFSLVRKKISFNYQDLKGSLCKGLSLDTKDEVITRLEQYGLFNKKNKFDQCEDQTSAATLLKMLMQHWQFDVQKDQDKIILAIDVDYVTPDNEGPNRSRIILHATAQDGFTAMERTVGGCIHDVCQLLLDESIEIPVGVHLPNIPEIYQPLSLNLSDHKIGIRIIGENVSG